MNTETLLRNIKDDATYALENSSADVDKLAKTLGRIKNLIEAQLADPEVQVRCGLYLHDGYRQYGYTFEQLQYFVKEWQDPKSVFYHDTWGFPSLLKWLYQVSRTSIGDLHGDLFKNVVATYHYPADMTDEECEALDKKYDKFWEDACKVIEGVENLKKKK